MYKSGGNKPQASTFIEELEVEIAEFVCLKRKIGLPFTCKTVKYKTWELTETHITRHYFNASTD